MNIQELLSTMVEKKASDIHIKAGRPPILRIKGSLVPMEMPPLDNNQVADLAKQVLHDNQKEKFETRNEFDSAYNWEGVARFRANVFRQRGLLTMVMRIIPARIATLDELDVPPVLRQIATTERGLVLVTGATGSGKSTTLAGMINEINLTMANHIVTIEDPIEFVHADKMSSICQREVGLDTETFASALRYVLRQDPDVILIGEMRDTETVRAAISAAETGHMVFSTLHTIDAIQSINRIIDFFPDIQQNQVRQQLATALKAVISQRLVVRADGSGRVPAAEIMVCTPTIRSLIAENKVNQIRGFIKDGAREGMQSFDQALVNLYKAGKISKEEALSNATSPQEIELAMKGITSSRGSAQSIMATMVGEQSRAAIAQSMERGISFFKRQMFAEAQAEFKKVLNEDPEHSQAKAYMKEIADRQAKGNLTQDAKSFIKRGLDLYQEEKIQEAINQWQEALKIDPENAQAKAYIKGAQDRVTVLAQAKQWVDQGVAAYQAGNLAGAIGAWEQALKVDPHHEQARTYLQEGKKRLKEMENDREAKQHFVNGAAYYQKGELLDAVMEWNTALSFNPQYQEAAEYAAEAMKHLEVQQIPDFDVNASDAAVIVGLYKNGIKNYVELRFLQAANDFRKAKEKRPTHQYFGALAEKAKQRHLEKMALLNAKANESMAKDQMADAVAYWREALQLDPEDPLTKKAVMDAKPKIDQAAGALYSQAMEFSQANKHKEAIYYFERVLALDPDHETAKRKLEDSKVKYEKLKEILSQMKT